MCHCLLIEDYLSKAEYKKIWNEIKEIYKNKTADIKLFFKKMGIYIICLPFVPVMILYVLMRKCFTEKPISIDKFIRKQK